MSELIHDIILLKSTKRFIFTHTGHWRRKILIRFMLWSDKVSCKQSRWALDQFILQTLVHIFFTGLLHTSICTGPCAFTMRRQMGWLNGLTKRLKIWFFHDEAQNWDKWFEPVLFAVWESHKPPEGFRHSKKKPHGVLDVIWEKWEEESTSKSKIQCILDPSAKLHTLGYWKIVVYMLLKNPDSNTSSQNLRSRWF